MEQVTLDLIPVGAKTVCHASQYDIGRTIRFNLVNNNQPVTLAGTETIVVKITKPDGTTIEKYLSNTSSTYVDWVTGEGDCDQAGIYNCEIKLTDGSAELGSKNFTIKVEEDPYNGEEVITETASGDPAVFTTNLVDLFVEIKCNINAIQEGTPWIDSNIINKQPYLYRKTAGTASRIGNSEFNKLVGGSVNFNQLVQFVAGSGENNGITFTINADGTITTAGTSTGTAYLNPSAEYSFTNHKILFCGCPAGGSDYGYYVKNGYANAPIDTGNGAIANVNGSFFYQIIINNGVNADGLKFIPQAIDLTAFFGSSEIADYLYTLEQTTAGAGVAKFRELFSKPYYPYTASSLLSATPLSKFVVGKNLLDVDKMFNYSGAYTINPDNSVTIIDNDYRGEAIMPTMTLLAGTYTVSGLNASGTTQISYYNDNGQLTSVLNGPVTSASFTLDKKRDIYIRSGLYGSFPFNIKPQLEVGSTATAYEPYSKHEYNFTGSRKVKRKFGIVDLSTLTWIDYGNDVYVCNSLTNAKATNDYDGKSNVISEQYINGSWSDVFDYGRYGYVCLREITVGDIRLAVKSSSSPTGNLIYELATPTEETVTTPKLLGLFKVDNNGNIYAYGDELSDIENPEVAGSTEEFIDGNVYGRIDLGSLEWQADTTTRPADSATIHAFYSGVVADVKKVPNNQTVPNMYCEGYEPDTIDSVNYGGYNAVKDKIIGGADGLGRLWVYNSDYNDMSPAEFKQAISGTYLTYEKASSSGVEIPVGHESFYADIYPIFGHTQLDLVRIGANQWDEQWEVGTYALNTINSKNPIYVLPNTAYYFKCNNGGVIYEFDNNGTNTKSTTFESSSSFTTRSDTAFVKFYVNTSYGTTYNHDISINYPTTDTAYHAYEGTKVTISFGQTVYTGYLNVTTGKLTITEKIVGISADMLSYPDWNSSYNNIAYCAIAKPNDSASKGNADIHLLSSDFAVLDNRNSNWDTAEMIGKIAQRSTYTDYWFGFAHDITFDDMKNTLTGMHIVYELATPTEIQLTAHQLETILGQNILSHDCNGTTEVKYLYNA